MEMLICFLYFMICCVSVVSFCFCWLCLGGVISIFGCNIHEGYCFIVINDSMYLGCIKEIWICEEKRFDREEFDLFLSLELFKFP